MSIDFATALRSHGLDQTRHPLDLDVQEVDGLRSAALSRTIDRLTPLNSLLARNLPNDIPDSARFAFTLIELRETNALEGSVTSWTSRSSGCRVCQTGD